jgi:adenylate cyclase
MKTIQIFLILYSISISLAAQVNTDSLWKLWNDTRQPDTTRLYALDDLAWDIRNKNPDSAILLANLELDFATTHNFKDWQAKACNMLGVGYYIKSDYSKAIEWHKKCFTIWEALGDKPGMASSYNNLGNVYSDLGNYTESLDSYQKGLALEETKKRPLTGTYHLNIGAIYLDRGSYPKALEQFQQSLSAYEKEEDKQGMGMAYNNIGLLYDGMNSNDQALSYYNKSVVISKELGDERGLAEAYTNIGVINKKQGNYAVALDYQQKSLAIEKKLGDEQSIAGIYGIIGEIYDLQGQVSPALENFEKCLTMSLQLGMRSQVAYAYINIGSLHSKQKDYHIAESWALKGLKLAKELGSVTYERDGSKLLYEIYKALGKGNEALAYHEKFLVLTDSIETSETNKKLDQMEFAKIMLADSLKKEKEKVKVQAAHEKEVAQKNEQRNVAVYIGGGILLLAGGLWSRLRYVRKTRAVIQKEKDRSDNLLLNILPAEIAEELKIYGKAEARDFDPVSILFTDFKEFTSMSEKMSAKELVSEINYCFEAFDRIAGKYKIEKIKTIGDSYMAAGGLPGATPESVKNTVMAALEMQAFIQQYKIHKDTEGAVAFQMRVGIHTGPVVAGIVGVKKFQYDIWGDTVNTASRMESSGAVDCVNISETTYALIKDEPMFLFQSRGRIQAKGKGEIEMYFVELRKE